MNQLPPGPRGLPIIGSLFAYARDPLGYLQYIAYTFGGMGRFRVGPMNLFVISDPALIYEVLVAKASRFRKEDGDRIILSRFLGNGLVTSEGDFWRKQRRLVQPAFHTKRIQSYAEIMVQQVNALITDWRDGEEREIADEMMRVALGVVSRALFGSDVSSDVQRISNALTELQEIAIRQMKIGVPIPLWLPLPQNRRHKRALAELDSVILRIISYRRKSQSESGDLLSMLLEVQDAATHTTMSDQQLRDEVTTLFVAGHETAASTLTWIWYLLSRHSEVEHRLHYELDNVLGDRLPTIADLPKLQYLEQIMKETLRLYPPIWTLNGRQANDDVLIGDYVVPKNSIVMISPYVLHHHPQFFPNPDQFDPDRFCEEVEAQIPKYAYLPFGTGQRICIGSSFAMMEIKLVIATIAQRFRLCQLNTETIQPEPLITLRPKSKLRMTIRKR